MAIFEKALKIDANYHAEKSVMSERLMHTRRLVHLLFEQMDTVSEHLVGVRGLGSSNVLGGHRMGQPRRAVVV